MTNAIAKAIEQISKASEEFTETELRGNSQACDIILQRTEKILRTLIQDERDRCLALVSAKPKVHPTVSTWYFDRAAVIEAIRDGRTLEELEKEVQTK